VNFILCLDSPLSYPDRVVSSPFPPPSLPFPLNRLSSVIEGLKVSRCVRLPHYDFSVTSTCVINQCPSKDSMDNTQDVMHLRQPFRQCLYVCTSSTVFFVNDSIFTTKPSRRKEDLIALGIKELELSRSRFTSGVKAEVRVPGKRSKVPPLSYADVPLDPLARTLSCLKTR
jgi:hypothetical protein